MIPDLFPIYIEIMFCIQKNRVLCLLTPGYDISKGEIHPLTKQELVYQI